MEKITLVRQYEGPKEIWGITTYFNYFQDKNRYENYKIFRESLRRQGLNLLTVELAFHDAPFMLDNKNDNVLQIRTGCVIAQKERMINLALNHLPAECKNIVWIDADVIFEDKDWIKKTSKALEANYIVQPFSDVVFLNKPFDFVSDIQNNLDDATHDKGVVWNAVNRFDPKYPGSFFVFAANRGIVAKHSLYDRGLLGESDRTLLMGWYGLKEYCGMNGDSKPLKEDKIRWARENHRYVKNKVSYVEGKIYHLFHGKSRTRFYIIRNNIAGLTNYDPLKDIKIDDNGLYVWTQKNPVLHFLVKLYFWQQAHALVGYTIEKTVLFLILKIKALKRRLINIRKTSAISFLRN